MHDTELEGLQTLFLLHGFSSDNAILQRIRDIKQGKAQPVPAFQVLYSVKNCSHFLEFNGFFDRVGMRCYQQVMTDDGKMVNPDEDPRLVRAVKAAEDAAAKYQLEKEAADQGMLTQRPNHLCSRMHSR